MLAGEVKDFGLVSTAFGLGGLIGAIFTYLIAAKFKEKSPNIFGLILSAIVISVSLNHSLNILVGLMVCAGILLTMTNNIANSNLQLMATNKVRGKYASLFQLAFRGGLSLGALTTGLMTSQWGIITALLINGTMATIATLLC